MEDPKPERDMDEQVKIDMEFEDALKALLTDPELPPIGEPLTNAEDEAT